MDSPFLGSPPLLWAVILAVLAVNTSEALKKPPNIVFIFADDLGWNDIGFNNPDIISPHIDGLANSGVILEQSYVQPVCTPSRAAMMTGVYPFRLGLQHLVILSDQAVCVPFDRTFLPETLKDAGYATHAVGKWHLGFCNKKCTPTYRGFDSFLGCYNGGEDYYTKEITDGFDFRDNEVVAYSYAGNYSTYQYSERVREIISSHDVNKPLFLYLPYQSVHTPLQVPKKYLDMYPNMQDSDRKTFSAMVTALDDSIGELIESLKTKGIYDNTLIVFSGDNGGMAATGGNNYPLRGAKSTVFEGGTRAPAFVHGPMFGTVGVRYDGIIHAVDWFPTLLEAAGIENTESDLDGISQWQPLINQRTPSNRQEIVYNLDDSLIPITGKAAIRVGDYKLIDGFPGAFKYWYQPGQKSDGWGELSARRDYTKIMEWIHSSKPDEKFKFLFNLKDDPNEHDNLYDQYPGIVKRLESKLQYYHRERSVPANFPRGDRKSNPNKYGGVWSSGWC